MSRISSRFAICILCSSSCLVYAEGPEYYSSSSAITINQDGDGQTQYKSEEKINNNGEKSKKSDEGVIVVDSDGSVKMVSKNSKDKIPAGWLLSEPPARTLEKAKEQRSNFAESHPVWRGKAQSECDMRHPQPPQNKIGASIDNFFDGGFAKFFDDDFFKIEKPEGPDKTYIIKDIAEKYRKVFIARVNELLQWEWGKSLCSEHRLPPKSLTFEQIENFETEKYDQNLVRVMKAIYTIGKKTRDEFRREIALIK